MPTREDGCPLPVPSRPNAAREERQIRELRTLRFIHEASNVMLLGPPGVDKTHLAVALAEASIRAGYAAYFMTAHDLVDDLGRAYREGRLERRMRIYLAPKVLIIDEILAVGDLYFQKKCIDRIFEFRGRGKTILFCSHSMYDVRQICDEVIWVKLGTFPDMSIENARKAAERELGDIAKGLNPAEKKRAEKKKQTLGDAWKQYWDLWVEPQGIKRADDLKAIWQRFLGPLPDEPAKKHGRKRKKHPAGVDWSKRKLEAIGFGLFIPVFFVTSGIQFDLDALFASGSTIARVPIFLVALLLVRGLPALVYRSTLGPGQTMVAGLLQATSLPFIVAAAMIGIELGLLDEATGAALIAAGLLSILIFPLLALTLLRRTTAVTAPPARQTQTAAT